MFYRRERHARIHHRPVLSKTLILRRVQDERSLMVSLSNHATAAGFAVVRAEHAGS
jgi:hypothetical protein